MFASAVRRRFTLSIASVCVVLALAACRTDVPSPEVPSPDAPAADVPVRDLPAERRQPDAIRIYQPPLQSSRPPTA